MEKWVEAVIFPLTAFMPPTPPHEKMPNSRFPADLGVLPGGCFWIFLPMAFMTGWLGCAFYNARRTGDMTVVWLGGASGLIGAILLFVARLPLYRQRRFFVFGPKELDERHRRLYFLAYAFVVVGVGLLGLLLVCFWYDSR